MVTTVLSSTFQMCMLINSLIKGWEKSLFKITKSNQVNRKLSAQKLIAANEFL